MALPWSRRPSQAYTRVDGSKAEAEALQDADTEIESSPSAELPRHSPCPHCSHCPDHGRTVVTTRLVAYAAATVCAYVLLVLLGVGIMARATGVIRAAGGTTATTAATAATVAETATSADRGQPDEHGHTCGNSSAEAYAKGCSFDMLTFAWLPPGCPHYANDAYLANGPWNMWTDPYHQRGLVRGGDGGSARGVPGDDSPDFLRVLDNQLTVYTERSEHLTHCVYFMLSLAMVIRDGSPLTASLSHYEHHDHCAVVLLESLQHDPLWKKVDTKVPPISYSEKC